MSSACHFGSGGAGGAATFAAGRLARRLPPPAAAGAPLRCLAHGAGPSTSIVSNLITSTGHPSAATMIDGVSGLRKSALIAGGRMRQVCFLHVEDLRAVVLARVADDAPGRDPDLGDD